MAVEHLEIVVLGYFTAAVISMFVYQLLLARTTVDPGDWAVVATSVIMALFWPVTMPMVVIGRTWARARRRVRAGIGGGEDG